MKLFSGLGRLLLSLGAIGFLGAVGANSFTQPASTSDREHSSPAMARVIWPNGDSRTLSFRGVGCAISMCSRVRIQSKIKDSLASHNTWLDAVASISDITTQDALFLFKDGSARRLPIVAGNRFLYFGNGKAEIGRFKSVEFLDR